MVQALIDTSTIIISHNGETILVGASDAAYGAIKDYLTTPGQEPDFDYVRDMVIDQRAIPRAVLRRALAAVDGEALDTYRVKHGDPVEDVILEAAISLTAEQADITPLARFLKRLERNPSPASRSQLFGFLKANGFKLTADGMIIAFKSVRADGLSSNSGREPVTVVHQDGTVETVTGHVPYPVGSTVWMPRHYVNDDRQTACSVGIHAGSWSYASNFADHLLVVLIDPADVVSVPADHSCQKVRVCRLRVAAVHNTDDGDELSEDVVRAVRTAPDFDSAEEYAARPENKVERPMFNLSDYPVVNVFDWDGVEDAEWVDLDFADEDADEDEDESFTDNLGDDSLIAW